MRRKKLDEKQWYRNIELLWDNHHKPSKDIEDDFGTLRIVKTTDGFMLSRSMGTGNYRTYTSPIFVKKPT